MNSKSFSNSIESFHTSDQAFTCGLMSSCETVLLPKNSRVNRDNINEEKDCLRSMYSWSGLCMFYNRVEVSLFL